MKTPVRLTKQGKVDKRAASARKMAREMTPEQRAERARKGGVTRWTPMDVLMTITVPSTAALEVVLRRLGSKDSGWNFSDAGMRGGTFTARTGAMMVSGQWRIA